jgi:GH25 family lysozyme M1 (1,4-beta-N-acetylmuramidase)
VTLYYPDVSSFQGGIRLSGAHAVCAKVTQGTGYVSQQYAPQRAQAAALGATFFAYHFLQQSQAAAQAAWCHEHAGATPLMVDFEPYPQIRSYPVLADAVAFIDAYRKLSGVTHLVYLPKWYWQQLGSPGLGALASRGCALVSSDYAAYTDANSGVGWQPYGGMTPQIWQYTDTMAFGGLSDVDFNAFRGSYAGKEDPVSVQATVRQLQSLITTGSISSAPAMVTVPVTFGEVASVAMTRIQAAGLTVSTNPARDSAHTYVSAGSSPIGGSSVPKGSHVILNVRVTG